MGNYTSMVERFSDIVDCRMIQIELEFSRLTQLQLSALAEFCFHRIYAIVKDEFVTAWDWGSRRVKPEKLYDKIRASTEHIMFDFEGYVISNVIYDAKSMRSFDRMLLMRTDIPWSTNYSIDYPDVFWRYFSGVTTPEACKEALLRIFNERGRKMLSLWRAPDVQGIFFSSQHWNNRCLYHGKLQFHIALGCLGSDAGLFSEVLTDLLRQAAGDCPNISGRVTLSPIPWPDKSCCSHMRYFSRLIKDGSHAAAGFAERSHIEWYPYYYLNGAVWFNVLTPLQLTHIPNIGEMAKNYPEIILEWLPNGSAIVRLKKAITEIDVEDLTVVKKLLYRALWQGKRTLMLQHLFSRDVYISYGTKPRVEWEYAPIFEEEIQVFGDSILFQHISNGDG